jgi:hypothetical protein
MFRFYLKTIVLCVASPYLKKKHPQKMMVFGGLAGNRTWIESFGNSSTIHCTTRPLE